jgi:phosphoribosyl 1,2-cyclic phosphodiesterase
MRFACLGSGSRGNATLVEAGGVRVLVDCGFALRELERRLGRLGVAADTLDAVLLTHEHGDHARGIAALSRRYGMPVWMTHGTAVAAGCTEITGLRRYSCHGGAFAVGDLAVTPYAVPHDAREPSQFLFCHGGLRFAMLTDTGGVTPHILDRLHDCDALLLECNHDRAMLATGPYPPALRARVGGAWGHLGNHQAADLLGRLEHGRLRHLVAAHLSEKNNRPDKARAALLEAAPGVEDRLWIAEQDGVSPWLEL